MKTETVRNQQVESLTERLNKVSSKASYDDYLILRDLVERLESE